MNKKELIIIVLIVLVIVLTGVFGYMTLVKRPISVERSQNNNMQGAQPTSNISSQNPSTSQPIITSITPNPVSVGSTVTISGKNLNIVRENYAGMHPPIIAEITNTAGQVALIFLPQGTAEQINFPLPSKACKKESAGLVPLGDCPPNGYMTISPGRYTIDVTVSGRPGISNTVNITIQ